MGQYYRPTILGNNGKIKATTIGWDWGCMGAKLMETSWVHNPMVNAVEQLLAGKFKGSRVVWAGDYADERENGRTTYDMASDDNATKVTDLVEVREVKYNNIPYKETDFVQYKWVLNRDKKIAVEIPKYDSEEWNVHPLPILTADGNGRGGGDYGGTAMEYVGAWAYDHISVANRLPKGYKKIDIRFAED